MNGTVVLSRSLDDGRARRAAEESLAASCTAAGLDVLVVPPLYQLPDAGAVWEELAALEGPVAWVSWLFPRPAEALLRHRGVWREGHRAFDLSGTDSFKFIASSFKFSVPSSKLTATDKNDRANPKLETENLKLETPGLKPETENLKPETSVCGRIRALTATTTTRWYPVVDPARCQNCRNCLQFCLFGVYALGADQKVRVQNPDQCKPGCPACSRICPSGAIMFPLYEKDAAIAGAPGKFMTPDLPARKMYYLRTGLPCPVCGRAGKEEARARGPVCSECGRKTASSPTGGDARGSAAPRDELDALMDDLDKLQKRSP